MPGNFAKELGFPYTVWSFDLGLTDPTSPYVAVETRVTRGPASGWPLRGLDTYTDKLPYTLLVL